MNPRRYRIAFAVAALTTATSSVAPAWADCVTTLSYCAQRCDQRVKPGDPERPQCVRTCIASYQRCEQLEQLRSNTAPLTTPGKSLAP
jgi:hypothetical protein